MLRRVACVTLCSVVLVPALLAAANRTVPITDANQAEFYAVTQNVVLQDVLCRKVNGQITVGTVSVDRTGTTQWKEFRYLISAVRVSKKASAALKAKAKKKKAKLKRQKRTLERLCTAAAPTVAPATATAAPTPIALATATPVRQPTPGPTPAPQAQQILINAGGADYVDGSGRTWLADTAFVQGQPGGVFTKTDPITGTTDQALFQSERWGIFSYHVGVTSGTFRVTLYFNESTFSVPASRLFDIALEGRVVTVPLLDIFTEAGGKGIALAKTYEVAVHDGTLDIDFIPFYEYPKIDAIQLDRIGG